MLVHSTLREGDGRTGDDDLFTLESLVLDPKLVTRDTLHGEDALARSQEAGRSLRNKIK
jgi:hypothetical protein